MKILNKCVDKMLSHSIVVPIIWGERVVGLASKIYASIVEQSTILWNSRILKFHSLKATLTELKTKSKERSESLKIKLKAQKELEISELMKKANFGAENRLYNGALFIALNDALKAFEKSMEIEINPKNIKAIKNPNFLVNLEQNSINIFEKAFIQNSTKAFELVAKTHASMRKLGEQNHEIQTTN